MLVVYASKTGNVERFIKKTGYNKVLKIVNGDESISEPFIFLTYTTGIGEIPEETLEFCENHAHLLQGVMASGNRNWGANYAVSADKLSNTFGVPVLLKFEMAGRQSDVDLFLERVEKN